MACSAIRSPFLRNQSIRHYAAAAAAAHSSPKNANVEIKTLGNKVTLAALDNGAPVSQVSIVYRAGSRNETYDTRGAAHIVRLSTALSNKRSTGFFLTRNIQQLGGELTTTTDRETTTYTLRVARDHLPTIYHFLEDVATRQEFRPWELSDEEPRLRYEASNIPENSRLIELLYKAAYREGLGYSLYCPKRQIGRLSSESLCHYVQSNFTAARCAFVTTGISLREAESLATSLELPQGGEEKVTPAKFLGGEIRKDRSSQLASVAIAVEGVSYNNLKEALAATVLQKVAGEGPRVKWGADHGAAAKALASATSNPFAVIGLNTCHSDSGLFGLIISSPADNAGALVQAGVKWLRNPQFSDDDVKRAKAILKKHVLTVGDEGTLLHDNICEQLILTKTVTPIKAIADEIDKLSTADVKNIASKISKGKLALGAIGNLKTVPYVQQL